MIGARSLRIVGACLLSLAIGNDRACRAVPADAKPDKLKMLFEERARIAVQAYEACNAAFAAGTITIDQVLTTSNEVARAELALCKTKDERIEVHKAHVKREKSLENNIRRLAAVNAIGGEAEKVSLSGLNRVNAEIDLEQERRKTAAGENR